MLVILVVLTLMSSGVLTLARTRRAQARQSLEEVRNLQLIFNSLVRARGAGFQVFEDNGAPRAKPGGLHMETILEEPSRLRVICAVTSSLRPKKVETGWEKSGDGWRATYWREIN